MCSEILKRGDNIHEVQLCVVKYKKEVTMYMKYSSVCSEIVHCHLFLIFHYTELYFMHIATSEAQLCVVKHKNEVTMYMKYSCV
jgi:hypothetical protein